MATVDRMLLASRFSFWMFFMMGLSLFTGRSGQQVSKLGRIVPNLEPRGVSSVSGWAETGAASMQDLNDLYYFAQVVDHGGFAAAGRALGVPKSTLSRRITALEDRLGVRLLQRSSRRFAVTELGQDYYEHCKALGVEAEAAQAAIDRAAAQRDRLTLTFNQEFRPHLGDLSALDELNAALSARVLGHGYHHLELRMVDARGRAVPLAELTATPPARRPRPEPIDDGVRR